MTLTSFFMVVGLIGLVAFIGTVIYFHKQEITGTDSLISRDHRSLLFKISTQFERGDSTRLPPRFV